MADRYDVVIVGMGSGGMTAAQFAADVGRRVAVVERHRVGGDCLWTGCVPSKALLASAKVAHHLRHADRFGLPSSDASFDRAAVWRRVRAVRDEIAAGDDDPQRFRAMGVDVVHGEATLTAPDEVTVTAVDGSVRRLAAPTVLLCTGSRPAVPDVPGLADAGFLTSETLFELDDVPGRVVVIGGGPIAVEVAQALRRLEVDVTVLQRGPTILPRDEPELVERLHRHLVDEGVDIVTGVEVTGVGPDGVVTGRVGGDVRRWPSEAILVATGRRAVLDGLGLDAIGVEHGDDGIVVDDRLRTNVPGVYACGDVNGRDRFTHAAAYQSVIALRDAWFPGRGVASAAIPWATFTDPELAHAGLTAAEANDRYGAGRVQVHRWPLERNDRAHADGSSGAIVLVEHRGRLRRRLVGAHVLSESAGELIGELALAIDTGRSVADLGGLVHVYPTIATSVQQLGGAAATALAVRYRWLMRVPRSRRRWR